MKKILIFLFLVSYYFLNAQNHNVLYIFEDDTTLKNRCIETYSTALSFCGEYQKAICGFDSLDKQEKYSLKYNYDSLLFLRFKPVDAKDYIINQIKNSDKRVVFINEAHHLPQNRAFVFSLLNDLYKLGFRYLAGEAFCNSDTVLLGKNGSKFYPITETGFYTNEPNYGEVVRVAKKIGYHLVPYEEKNNSTKYTITIIDEDTIITQTTDNASIREKEQAENLTKIFQKDSIAKLVVLAGYGHIYRSTKSMETYFYNITKINPLIINQTLMYNHCDENMNNVYYKYSPDIDNPSVFISKDGQVFIPPENDEKYDIEVFFPKYKNNNGRLSFVSLNGYRKPIPYKEQLKFIKDLKPPLLLLAYYSDENMDVAIPEDIIIVKNINLMPSLFLPKGKFIIRILDRNYSLIKENYYENK